MDINTDYDQHGVSDGNVGSGLIIGDASTIMVDYKEQDTSTRMSAPCTPRPTSSQEALRKINTPVGHSVLNLSTIRSSPKFSFAGAGRVVYTPKVNSPGPGAYENIQTEETSRHFASPRYGFRPPPRDAARANTPGPGAYQHQNRIGTAGNATSFALSSPRKSARKLDSPGPGAHDVRPRFGEGPKFTAYGPRTDPNRKLSPGPGSYEHQRGLGVDGVAVSMAKKATSPRSRSIDSPGPGAHQLRSSFGDGPKYSMRSTPSTPRIFVPGPGSYEFGGFGASSGRQSPRWSIGNSPRKQSPESLRPCTPGPGQYEKQHHLSIGKDGPKFSHGSPHRPNYRCTTPGPGSYGGHWGTFH
eukprot:TRINITY_DN62831_c0_g1_i1.p1 TRINITY_DN62831_c0_g1~~TRINITY_DN62831_c0_g1_i1.p1  ORF type:complete len:356 (-),score=13.92 TRINITY_DN62831_c0_g1_i1:38-1105(-)